MAVAGALACSRAKGPDEAPPLSLVSAQSQAVAGDTFVLGVRIRIPDGWHAYWINPGDAGEPTRFDWDAPVGVSLTPLPWPIPDIYEYDGLVSYGYESEVIIPFQLSVAADAGPVTGIVCRARWMICQDICLPVEDRAVLSFASDPADEAGVRRDAAMLDRLIQALPQPDASWTFAAELTERALTMRAVPPPDMAAGWTERAVFLPEVFGVFEHRGSDGWHVDEAGPGAAKELPRFSGTGEGLERIEGVLILRGDPAAGTADRAIAVSVPVARP